MVALTTNMGRHKDWRKIAKRERRRRIRIKEAVDRDVAADKSEICLMEQQLCEDVEYEQIEINNKIENEKWLNAEKNAMERWNKLQEEKRKLIEKKLEEAVRIKLEWELEKKKREEEEERLRLIEEENKRKQQKFMENLELFLSGDSEHPPQELLVVHESRPHADPCPFFVKTACCRFGDNCSRNHQYPSISKILLATNFYAHFGLDNTFYNNEYDTDIMLEYDDSETYRQFKEFFFDVLPEFEKFGKVVMFKVCNNYEKHLRGNTYIEYANLRSAVAAYRSLHARWYGGRQLSLQFCNINSWKHATCGLQLRRQCPKGRSCNFLHIFVNPNNMFPGFETLQNPDKKRPLKSPSSRAWRWSESPEVEIIKSSKRRASDRREEKNHTDKRVNDYKRRRSPNRRISSHRRDV
ncbi:putative U2 small nuclear ribonucleoprotein auxiliary factor 35 kDa subunit-related protein 1 isoform X1 [Manduca sexta]|uniref:putative U2 small nuclear ribonucleoprotein auxiliary factor 35 kDa subunit-related protein 1 isoform X1 n=1 Tax=Manduca sexta TaxID=7130 RepID=UPI0011835B13|nr:putative U2 small nuclear ribonucleoprotein auxiliary factor 35 kDa subunit-related protein 1 isoform X1 [Manduca sexta]